MLPRPQFLHAIEMQFKAHPACGLLGPRQSGKTTLSNLFLTNQNNTHFFDLENPFDLAALKENAWATLERLSGWVILDEIQRLPEIFPTLRVLIDKGEARYLILGSASLDLLKQSSESLAGRIGYVELTPFLANEVEDIHLLLLRGGFPRSYLAEDASTSYLWRISFIQTFLERDIPSLGFRIPAYTLQRFWQMLTHLHGQLFNAQELSKSLGVSGHSIRHYLDILASTFMVRILQPWHENIGKRQIKTPKIYIRDSGILMALMGIENESQLIRHPKCGAIWEGFALEQIIQAFKLRHDHCFFWRTSNGAELDLFFEHKGKRFGFEFKYSDRPKVTPSMHIALSDLKLDHLFVICPGARSTKLSEKITLMSLAETVVMSMKD